MRRIQQPGRIITRWALAAAFLAAAAAVSPSALAQDKPSNPNAREYGFETEVQAVPGGVGTSWLLTILLALLCVGPLFKSAKKTHLD